jgi:GntR family transcriptional regulator / MocR family aminotransferase
MRAAPLYVQVYRRFRGAILAGGLGPGARLPSTRDLARDLRCSRTTAEQAYAQLEAEGYVVRRTGDGTTVADFQPEHPARPPRAHARPVRSSRRALSQRGQAVSASIWCEEPLAIRPFNAGLPALEAFPVEAWNRLQARCARRAGRALLGYGSPAGYPPLREAVAAYLGTSRGVVCSPEQVIILTSSQQALDLVTRMLLDPGDAAWLEEPGYLGARSALQAAGARVIPVPVDEEGLRVDVGRARAEAARLVYLTPSHQYPTGVTLSLERRLALVEWADRAGSFIIEDDYDSEFRYAGRPLAAIQGLGASDRILYVGTFTKVLFPSIRLAYLVAPLDLVGALVKARAFMDGHTPQLAQAVVAEFMSEGHFGSHVRRMRALYQERRDVLKDAAARTMGDRLRLGPSDAGLRVTAYLRPGKDDRKVAARAAARGLDVPPLSRFYLGKEVKAGLVLGYAGLSPAAIRDGMRTLSAVV